MSDEQSLKLLKWIPLGIAAGYFVFLIATWYRFMNGQQQMREQFDVKLEEWHSEWLAKKDAAVDGTEHG